MSTNKINCSFTVDRDIYNAYKSIVVKGGENVKGLSLIHIQMCIRDSGYYDENNGLNTAALEKFRQTGQSNKGVYTRTTQKRSRSICLTH